MRAISRSAAAQRVDVAAVEAEFERRHVLVVELLELDIGFGETVGPRVGVLVENGLRIIHRRGVDDELRVVLARDLRGVAHLEARRRAPHERGDRLHPFVGPQRPVNRIGDGPGAFQRRVGAQVDLHGELVPVGEGDHAELELRGDQQRHGHRGGAERDRQPPVAEGPRQHAAVDVVHPVGERPAAVPAHVHGRNDQYLEERNDHHGQQQRHHQVNGDRPREPGQEVAHHARHREEDRIEDHADTDRGQQQRGKNSRALSTAANHREWPRPR